MLIEGGRLVVAGGGVGIAVALTAARAVRPFLFGVGAADPVTFILGPAVLLLVSLAAALPPALRAGRLDPAAVLRSE